MHASAEKAALPDALARADNPDAVRNALHVERTAARDARRRAAQAERRLSATTARAEEVEAMFAELADRNRRLEVALAKGLPPGLVDRRHATGTPGRR